MAQKKIVWMPEPDYPEEFWNRFQEAVEEQAQILLLCEAHEKGWITIFGQTERDIRDIAAVLQEFFKVQVIDSGPRNDDRRNHG